MGRDRQGEKGSMPVRVVFFIGFVYFFCDGPSSTLPDKLHHHLLGRRTTCRPRRLQCQCVSGRYSICAQKILFCRSRPGADPTAAAALGEGPPGRNLIDRAPGPPASSLRRIRPRCRACSENQSGTRGGGNRANRRRRISTGDETGHPADRGRSIPAKCCQRRRRPGCRLRRRHAWGRCRS